MDLKVISELIKLVSESKLTSLEVQEKELRIKLEKNSFNVISDEIGMDRNAAVVENRVISAVPPAVNTINIDNNANAPVDNKSISSASVENENLKIVKAPIVGTFYLASSPDSEPFAAVGKKIKKGDTLCIIEAMKLMNEIESEFDGEISEVLLENGAIVEYGQPLFKIK
jgi:acetyl-CoA carboxylase biotin carboxyl carrier protein